MVVKQRRTPIYYYELAPIEFEITTNLNSLIVTAPAGERVIHNIMPSRHDQGQSRLRFVGRH